ncbi:MAG: hypothetical protein PHP50_14270 [Lachnospiraceae bacterium]|nr:hypothetical protein [Lachnospiraceae bacterium]
MRLHNILGGVGFITGIVGTGFLCGAVEKGTGIVGSVVLLIVSGISIHFSLKEGGYSAKKKSDHDYYCDYPDDIDRQMFR